MNCDRCGRKITKAYSWQGQILGSSCFKKVNPWNIDRAQTLLLVAEKFLNGDRSALSLIPPTWRRYLTSTKRVDDAGEHAAIYGKSHAQWLAILVRNDIARSGQQVFPLQDLLNG